MIIVFGSRLYGKTDTLSNGAYIATKFGHFDYLPLFPTESWLVFESNGKSWRGIRIPLSAKSVLLGYLRAWVGVAALLVAIPSVIFQFDSQSGMGDRLLLGAITLIVLAIPAALFACFRKASVKREELLMSMLRVQLDPAAHAFPIGSAGNVAPVTTIDDARPSPIQVRSAIESRSGVMEVPSPRTTI